MPATSARGRSCRVSPWVVYGRSLLQLRPRLDCCDDGGRNSERVRAPCRCFTSMSDARQVNTQLALVKILP